MPIPPPPPPGPPPPPTFSQVASVQSLNLSTFTNTTLFLIYAESRTLFCCYTVVLIIVMHKKRL